jgi:hypothetical protein
MQRASLRLCAGGDVLLAAPAEPVRRVLTLTCMASEFRSYATVAAAAAGAHTMRARLS